MKMPANNSKYTDRILARSARRHPVMIGQWIIVSPLVWLVWCLLAWPGGQAAEPSGGAGKTASSAQHEDFFQQQVAPILERHCIRCHVGPKAEGGLDLSRSDTLRAGGESGVAVVPGKPEMSLLLDYVRGEKPQMPKNAPPLSTAQVALLRRWITAGANFPAAMRLRDRQFDEEWWSLKKLLPVQPPALPAVASHQQGARPWARNPIDHFILVKLRQQGMEPAPEADRRTMIRRLYFDLLGLPPEPEAVDAFVNDASPKAYESLVDKLLASPRYGERWGRHWLDLVHYGDTHGYDKDKRRPHSWPYRDYVINALNQDKRFDRFVLEQLAGDVVAPHDPQAIAATGFVAAGPWDFVGHVELREGTVDKNITRLLDRDDMLANTMSTFASTTIHCARCHHHPFDPFKQQDYYGLQAVFAGVERGDRPWQDPARDLQRQANLQQLQRTEQRLTFLRQEAAQATSPRLTAVNQQLSDSEKKLQQLTQFFTNQTDQITSPSNGFHSNIMPTPEVVKWVQVDLGQEYELHSIRLIPARPTDYPDTPGFGFPPRLRVEASHDPTFAKSTILFTTTATEDYLPGDHPLLVPARKLKARYVRVTALRLWKRQNDFVFALGELQVESDGRNVARAAAVNALDSIEAGRWSTRYLVDGYNSRRTIPDQLSSADEAQLAQRAALENNARILRRQRDQLAEALVDPGLRREIDRLGKEKKRLLAENALLPPAPQVYALKPIAPRPIHLLHRGDVKQPGERMAPAVPASIRQVAHVFRGEDDARPETSAENARAWEERGEGARRLALARWLIHQDHPLTWRSIVNRVWQHHFGKGLVDSPNDFGRLGSTPTHPELLDWLAVWFRDNGQSLKQLHRLMVTSATYRQSSAGRADYQQRDASNRWLWRQQRRRLDAESVRDAILAISGSLNLTMGGPGFDLFGFKDDHSPHYLYDQHNVDDPRTWRRTVYRFVVRSVPDPFMECLDCADPSQNVPVRTETITALQALAVLNNPFVLRQSEHFANRVARLGKTPREQLRHAFRLALAREPSHDEQTVLLEFMRQHGLSQTCRVLWNTNEFLFID